MQFFSIPGVIRFLIVLVCLVVPFHLYGQGTEIAGSPIFDGGQLNPGEAKISVGGFNVTKSGAATYSIPLIVPPGTAGMTPNLSLRYNSHGRDGILGVRWSLGGLPAVTRCRATLAQDGQNGTINYDYDDRFCLDGLRLIAISGQYGADGTEYRTENDTFVKVVSHGVQGNGPLYFTAYAKSGRAIEYGNSADSRVKAKDKETVRVWAMNRVEDRSGNYMTVTYTQDGNGDYLPDRIDYTGNTNTGLQPGRSVQFSHESRPTDVDRIRLYQGGSMVVQAKRLSEINAYLGGSLVRKYKLTYDDEIAGTTRTRLAGIQECHSAVSCYDAFSFVWEKGGHSDFNFVSHNFSTAWSDWVFNGDYNGDGRTDLMAAENDKFQLYFSQGDGTFSHDKFDFNGSEWARDKAWRVDYNGDGLADLVSHANGKFHTYVSDGAGNFTHSEWTPFIWNGKDKFWVGDFNGDSRTDLLVHNNGYFYMYRATPEDPSHDYDVNISERPGDWKSDRVWALDVNGDGMTDMVSANGNTSTFHVFLSTGSAFTYEESDIDSGWNGSNVWVGDFNGDGLQDLITKTSGPELVTYFAKGDGHFEALMSEFPANSAWDTNDVWLGDFNADGKTDLVSTRSSDFNKFFSRGDGTFRHVRQSNFPDSTWDNGRAWTGDIDGDGIMDLVSKKDNPRRFATHFSADAYPDLIAEITTPIGGQFDIVYKPLTDGDVYTKLADAVYPIRDILAPFYVVASHTSHDGLGQGYEFSYQYTGLKNDLHGRGSLGFKYLQVVDNSGTDVGRFTEYRQDFPFTGLVAVSETNSSQGVFTTITNEWEENEPYTGVFFAALTQMDTEECKAGTNCRMTSKTMEYDAYGNHTRTNFLGLASSSTDDSEEVTEWVIDVGEWLHRPKRTLVKDDQGTVMRETWHSYDEEAWGVLGDRGLLTRTERRLEGNRGHSGNPVVLQEYDAYGNLEETTDPLGCVTTTQYETTYHTFPLNETTCLTATTNATTHFTWHEGLGLKESEKDPNNRTTWFFYDSFGRLTKIRGPLDTGSEKGTVSYEYHNWGDPTTSHVEIQKTEEHGQPGYVWKREYFDGLGRVWKVEHEAPQPFTRLTEYDSRNLVTAASASFASGETPVYTEFDYDVLGRVTEQRNAAGTGDESTVSTDYLPGQVTITDENGHVKRRFLDAFGRQTKVQEVLENSLYETTYVYDSLGQLKSIENAKGYETVIGYDLLGRKILQDEPGNPIWTYEYDKNGNLKLQTDANDQTITYDYDLSGRVTKKSYGDPTVQPAVHFAFDESSGTTIIDSAGTGNTGTLGGGYERRTGSECSVNNCVWMDGETAYGIIDDHPSLDAGYGDFSISVRFKPDASGRMQVLTRGGNIWYRIYRESNGWVKGGFYYAPNGYWKTAVGGYCPADEWCHVVLTFDRDETMDLYVNGFYYYSVDVTPEAGVDFSSNEYLALATGMGPGTKFEGVIDELKLYNSAIVPSDETHESIEWEYDDPSVPNSIGRLTQVTDRSGSETYEYDAMGRMTKTIRTVDGTQYTMTETFDSMSRTVTKKFPDNETFTYTYNSAGWPVSVTDFVDDVTYNARGQVEQIDYHNNVTTSRLHNPNTFRLEEILTNGLQDLSYDYDPKGNITYIDDGLGTATRDFDYDELDRLVWAEGPFGGDNQEPIQESYLYDELGNFTNKAGTAYLWNSTHPFQLDGTYQGGVSPGYEWDRNGNMLARGSARYKYDEDNQLVDLDGNSFAYDYTGRRVKKTSSLGTSRYPFKDYEIDETGAIKKYFSIAGQLVGARKTAGGNDEDRFYHTDHLGGTHVITGIDGLADQILEYDPWGRVSRDFEQLDNLRKFTGQEFDEETGHYYYGARYYHPELGRFISPDPFVQAPFNPQNLNRYSYVLNNPVNFTDPSGNIIVGISDALASLGGNAITGFALGFATSAFFEVTGAPRSFSDLIGNGTLGFGDDKGQGLSAAFGGIGYAGGSATADSVFASGGVGNGGGVNRDTREFGRSIQIEAYLLGQQMPGATMPFEITLEDVHTALSLFGMFPVLTVPVAIIESGLYIYEGRYQEVLTEVLNPFRKFKTIAQLAKRVATGSRVIRASSRKAARRLASEIAGDLGPNPKILRPRDIRGSVYGRYRNSSSRVGAQSADGSRYWRDDFLGNPNTRGPAERHINVRNRDGMWHIFY